MKNIESMFLCWWTGADAKFELTKSEFDQVIAARRDPKRRWCNIRGHRVYLCTDAVFPQKTGVK